MNTFVRSARRLALPVHKVLRRRKVELFFRSLNPSPGDTLLDVGGWTGVAGEFSPVYDFFERITTINLVPCDHGRADFLFADACEMPFASKSFDFVFSNAVIEHVGRLDRQQQMASEIQRVARKGYFVSTPNRWFPIDPHSYLPFLHLLPLSIRRTFNSDTDCDYWMLSPKTMKRLFPDASLIVTPDGTSIIAIGQRC